MIKDKLLKLDKILITILILIQPFIDVIKNNIVNDIQILGFSLFEFINIFLIFLCLGIVIYCSDNKKKYLKYIVYIIAFGIYFIFHCYNISEFNQSVYSKQYINYFVEFYYIYRTFVNPLMLILLLTEINKDKDYYIKVVEIFSLTVSLVIISANIFHFGYQTYGEGLCQYSIFDWFTFPKTTPNSFYVLTCKGLFSSGNQLSSIAFMILPVVLYATYKYRRKIDYLALICQIIAMYMLGTKVSTLGVVAVLLTFLIMYLAFHLFNKVKLIKVKLNNILGIFLISSLAFGLFFFSPRFYNMSFNNGISSIENIANNESLADTDKEKFLAEWELVKEKKCEKMNFQETNDFLTFFNTYKDYMGISEFIINAYEVEKHPVFWCDYLQTSKTNDYRILKTGILKNIYNENNNKLDKYLGMGYTLDFIYTESDYTYQLYSYGIFGIIILIGPYFLISLYILVSIFLNFKKKFDFENFLLLMGPFLALCVAYYSGHVLERTLPLLILAFVCGINLLNLKENK